MNQEYHRRKDQLLKLADHFLSETFSKSFCDAYVADTAFVRNDVYKREILTPAALLKIPREDESFLQDRKPLGTVVVMIPKNSLGLTLAKAIASSYLMGNKTIIYFPGQLKATAPVYANAILKFLDNVEIADGNQTSAQFMRSSLNNPDVKAIVIYGDDSWIDAYKSLAAETKTKIIFEGPGNDPMVVMPDANIDAAVAGAIEGGLNNGGQSCSAIERYFIHEDILEVFAERLIASLRKLSCGSPRKEDTDIGPIASRIIFNRIVKQLEESVRMGAVLRYGGNIIMDETTGFPVIVPAVLTACTIEMPLVANETFGPVFPLISFRSIEELMPMLDATKYGLNACIYGNAPKELLDYLKSTHRNFYQNSTCVSPVNLSSRLMDGGFRRSGIIWNFDREPVESAGIRNLAMELSN